MYVCMCCYIQTHSIFVYMYVCTVIRRLSVCLYICIIQCMYVCMYVCVKPSPCSYAGSLLARLGCVG